MPSFPGGPGTGARRDISNQTAGNVVPASSGEVHDNPALRIFDASLPAQHRLECQGDVMNVLRTESEESRETAMILVGMFGSQTVEAADACEILRVAMERMEDPSWLVRLLDNNPQADDENHPDRQREIALLVGRNGKEAIDARLARVEAWLGGQNPGVLSAACIVLSEIFSWGISGEEDRSSVRDGIISRFAGTLYSLFPSFRDSSGFQQQAIDVLGMFFDHAPGLTVDRLLENICRTPFLNMSDFTAGNGDLIRWIGVDPAFVAERAGPMMSESRSNGLVLGNLLVELGPAVVRGLLQSRSGTTPAPESLAVVYHLGVEGLNEMMRYAADSGPDVRENVEKALEYCQLAIERREACINSGSEPEAMRLRLEDPDIMWFRQMDT